MWLAYGGGWNRCTTLMLQLHDPIMTTKLEEIFHEERARLMIETGTTPSFWALQVLHPLKPPLHLLLIECHRDTMCNCIFVWALVLPCVSATHGVETLERHEASQPPIAPSSQKRAWEGSTTIHEVRAPSLKKHAKIAKERFFYQCNIAFNVACIGAYKRLVNAIWVAPVVRAPIMPVNWESLCTTQLIW